MTRFFKSLLCAAAIIPFAHCASLAPIGRAVAQTPAPIPAAPAEVEDADPALWVIKDADTTIYLFGTVHMLKPGLGWFDEAVKDAFDKSDTLKIEAVLPEDPGEFAKRTNALALEQTGTTIMSQLTEPQQADYLAALAQFGLLPAQLVKYEPWFVGLTLSSLKLLADGYQVDQGSEKILTKAAKDANKPIAGLETLEEQMGFFDTLSREAQLRFLNETVEQMPAASAEFADILLAWARGDPEELGERMNKSMSGNPELASVLLYQRNERWADWIETRLAKPGSVFMAVGAGHLAGPQSVQDFLTARGLSAERITY